MLHLLLALTLVQAPDTACSTVQRVALDSILKLHVRADTSASGVTQYQVRQAKRLDSLLTAKCAVAAAPPDTAPTPPSTVQDSVLALMGPAPSIAANVAAGADRARYEVKFRANADSLWTRDGAGWIAANYYDRAAIYYTAFARGGVASDTARARQLVEDYMQNYVLNNGSGPYRLSPRNAQVEGLYLDWLVRGDSASRKAVIEVAKNLSPIAWANYVHPTKNYEGRIQARVLLSNWLAEQITPTPAFSAAVDSVISYVAQAQAPDGSFPQNASCGGQMNYMAAMATDAVARAAFAGRRSPVTDSVVVRSARFLASQFAPGTDALQYLSVDCPSNFQGVNVGSTTPAPDLNGLILPVFGAAYRITGDPAFKTAADRLLHGVVFNAFLHGGKQFNESFNGSYRGILP